MAGCTTYGSTPASNSPSDIVTAIQLIYTNRYTSGQNSVIGNPNNYSLYTSSQYAENYNAGYNSGYTDGYNQYQSELVWSTCSGSFYKELYNTWGVVYENVTFSKTFVNPPTMSGYADSYTPWSGDTHTDGNDCFTFSNITTTGCTVGFSNYSHDGNHTIHWTASGYTRR